MKPTSKVHTHPATREEVVGEEVRLGESLSGTWREAPDGWRRTPKYLEGSELTPILHATAKYIRPESSVLD